MNIEKTGIFSIAFRLIVFLLIIDRLFNIIFFPVISRKAKGPQNKLKKQIEWSLKIVIAISLIIAVFFLIIADDLIPLLFGFKYYDSILIFKILLFYFIITFINSVFTFTLIGLQKEYIYTKSVIIGAFLFFLLLIIPISLPEDYKVAIALSINEITSMFIMIFSLHKIFRIKIILKLFMSLTIYVMFFIYDYYFSLYYNPITIIIIVITFLLIILFSGIRRNDIIILKNYLK